MLPRKQLKIKLRNAKECKILALTTMDDMVVLSFTTNYDTFFSIKHFFKNCNKTIYSIFNNYLFFFMSVKCTNVY